MWAPNFRDISLNIFDSPREFFQLSDCIVDIETGLIYKNGEIFWEAANENIIWFKNWITTDSMWTNRISRQQLILERMKGMTDYLEEKIKNSQISEIDKGVTLHFLHPFNRYVYGHIYDTFQKLYITKKNKLNFDSVLLSSPREINNFEDHMHALELNKKILISSSEHSLVKVKNLIFIKPVAHPTTFTVESYQYLRDMYYTNLEIDGSATPVEKIFLTRRPGINKRALLNDVEIRADLVKIGVHYLDGTEPFLQVAKLFSKASHVSGVHGAQFVNNIFANENTKYLEFCPLTRPTSLFRDQYKLCQSYKYILHESDEGHNISLDVNRLLNFYSS